MSESTPSSVPSPARSRLVKPLAIILAAGVLAAAAYGGHLLLNPPPPPPFTPTAEGQAEAAEDALKLLAVKPGARVIAYEPYFAQAWHGEHVPIGSTMAELEAQLAAGQGDFVVVDDFTIRRHLPALKPLVSGMSVGPGAGLVYRRYLKDRDRLFSVYRAGASPLEIRVEIGDDTGPDEVTALLVKARQYHDHGYVEQARQMLEGIVAARPGLALAHRELMKVYMVLGYFDGASLDRAEEELVRYAFLAGDQVETTAYRRTLLDMRARHDALWGGK